MISSNISSINAHQTWMNSSAYNVANINNSDFSSQNTTMSSAGDKGVVANSTSSLQTDLSKEVTDQIDIQKTIEANATSIKTQDQLLGSLLDIKA